MTLEFKVMERLSIRHTRRLESLAFAFRELIFGSASLEDFVSCHVSTIGGKVAEQTF